MEGDSLWVRVIKSVYGTIDVGEMSIVSKGRIYRASKG